MAGAGGLMGDEWAMKRGRGAFGHLSRRAASFLPRIPASGSADRALVILLGYLAWSVDTREGAGYLYTCREHLD